MREQFVFDNCADAKTDDDIWLDDIWLQRDRKEAGEGVRDKRWFLTKLGSAKHKFFETFAALPPQRPQPTGRWWERGQFEEPFAAEDPAAHGDFEQMALKDVDVWGEWLSRAATLPLPYGFKIAPRDDATLRFCESAAAQMLQADWFILSDGSISGLHFFSDPQEQDWYDGRSAPCMLLLLRAPLESQGECGRLVVRDDDPNMSEQQIQKYMRTRSAHSDSINNK
jgi:hypothetical protein